MSCHTLSYFLKLLFFLAFFHTPLLVYSQHLLISSGGGYPFASDMDKQVPQTLTLRPHFGLSVLFPLDNRFLLEMGAAYCIKGYLIKRAVGLPDIEITEKLRNANRLCYLNIPLILNYKLYERADHLISVGMGMSYGFLLRGDLTRTTENTVYGIHTKSIVTNTWAKGWQSSNVFIQNPIEMLIMDTDIRLQLSYVFKGKYVSTVYYEKGLYNIKTVESLDGSSLQTNYVGLSLGLLFPKMKSLSNK